MDGASGTWPGTVEDKANLFNIVGFVLSHLMHAFFGGEGGSNGVVVSCDWPKCQRSFINGANGLFVPLSHLVQFNVRVRHRMLVASGGRFEMGHLSHRLLPRRGGTRVPLRLIGANVPHDKRSGV